MNTYLSNRLLIITLAFCVGTAAADEIRIAVASNFSNAIKSIAKQYEEETGHEITLSFASTGKHYAQIINGAPFDIFFAADVRRPELLEKEGQALAGSRFTYAIGRLVLWSPVIGYVDANGAVLEEGGFNHLAIANPKLAPYGKAAREYLIKHGLWDDPKIRVVRGENIGQTFQFVKSGNAELGFIAYSQLMTPGQDVPGSLWEIPQVDYTPIEQQAVLLRPNKAARDFLSYVQTDMVREIIRSYGYVVP